MYGLGSLTLAQWHDCHDHWWGILQPACYQPLDDTPQVVAPPGAPSGSVLTVPPASGADAQATVDALLNQQLRDQQKLDAAGVSSSWWDSIAGGAYSVGSSAVGAIPWGWIAAGVGIFALVAVGGGSPRRYGR